MSFFPRITPTVSAFSTVDEAIQAAGDDWRTAAVNVCRHLSDGCAHVAFEDNGGTAYTIWRSTGRIAFYPAEGVSWSPGDEFTVTVDDDGIHVKLT